MSIEAIGEKVVYQYMLVKKVRRNPYWVLIYISLFFSFGLALHAAAQSPVVWLAMGAAIVLFGVHEYIAVMALSWARPDWGALPSRWRWAVRFPWIGYLPGQGVSIRVFRSVQFHCLWLNCLLGGIAFSWLSPWESCAGFISIMWMVGPRLWLLAVFRQWLKESYLIRFQEDDVSLYIS